MSSLKTSARRGLQGGRPRTTRRGRWVFSTSVLQRDVAPPTLDANGRTPPRSIRRKTDATGERASLSIRTPRRDCAVCLSMWRRLDATGGHAVPSGRPRGWYGRVPRSIRRRADATGRRAVASERRAMQGPPAMYHRAAPDPTYGLAARSIGATAICNGEPSHVIVSWAVGSTELKYGICRCV